VKSPRSSSSLARVRRVLAACFGALVAAGCSQSTNHPQVIGDCSLAYGCPPQGGTASTIESDGSTPPASPADGGAGGSDADTDGAIGSLDAALD